MDKKEEYQERYRFWTDKRIAQLSFHNNILLTISFVIIGYFWKERDSVYTDLIIDTSLAIEWKIVFFFAGILFILISIFTGFLLSISRLYDLRITSNILLTRKRALDEKVCIQDEKLSDSKFTKSIKSLLKIFFNYRKYEITYQDIKEETKGLQNKFTIARQISRDLGHSTWELMKSQTISLFLSIMFFTLVLILK